MTPEEISRSYSATIVIRRWAATFIDLIVLASFLLIPDWLLGNRMYQKTIAVWLSLFVLYYPLLEGFTGYTVGKFVLRIRVVDEKGQVPGIVKALQRTLTRLIEVNPFLFGGVPAGIIVLYSKTRQRLGDMWAKTFVLRVKDLQGSN